MNADDVRSAWRSLRDCDDPALVITLLDEQALEQAITAADESGALTYWPFVVKDNIDVAGMPTTAGCPSYGYEPAEDATVVGRLRAAGAIPLAKVNLDQFATGLVGTRSPYGVPRNALAPAHVPGGSSSGSGVAVSRGLVPFALGTDTAGSGRVPAAFGAVIGCKPTRGLLSTKGVVPAVASLDCVSIMADTCATAEAVLAVAGGYDATDRFSRPAPASPLPQAPQIIGVPLPEQLDLDSDADRAAFQAACEAATALGCAITAVDIAPFLETATLLYGGPWVAERTVAVGDFLDGEPDDADPTVSAIIRAGRQHPATAAFSADYRLRELRRAACQVWGSVDALLLPTTPGIPSLDAVAADPVGVNTRLGSYNNFVNLLDCCGLTVPSPLQEDQLPRGVTLIAQAGADGALLQLGAALHPACGSTIGATGRPIPQAPTSPVALQAGWHRLAVFGAHLRGQPLEEQLVERGAIFLDDCQTAPEYRAYRLSETKPGLVRVDDGGASIAGEIWAIDDAGLGSFLAAIPAPLGLGSISLADGSSAIGFLCEAYAVDGCEDITAYGGWRAALKG